LVILRCQRLGSLLAIPFRRLAFVALWLTT
jgi:hypothetical protein